MAKMAGALQEVAEGRFILGIGAGNQVNENTAFGHNFANRIGAFKEYLPIMTALLKGETVTFERDSLGSDGLQNQQVTYVPLRLPGGDIDGFVAVAQDVTAQKREELRLLQLSERDALTGVLNRQGLETYLAQRHDKHDEGLALLPSVRDIVRRTMDNSFSVSSLARDYPMSFAAVQKHVAVLERAGLVTKQRRGREHLVTGNAGALHAAHDALNRLELLWRERVARMDDLLATDPEP